MKTVVGIKRTPWEAPPYPANGGTVTVTVNFADHEVVHFKDFELFKEDIRVGHDFANTHVEVVNTFYNQERRPAIGRLYGDFGDQFDPIAPINHVSCVINDGSKINLFLSESSRCPLFKVDGIIQVFMARRHVLLQRESENAC